MALTVSGAVVFLALVALLLEVRADPPGPQVSQEELARAAAAGRSLHSASPTSSPAAPRTPPNPPNPSIPPPRSSSAPEASSDRPQLPPAQLPAGKVEAGRLGVAGEPDATGEQGEAPPDTAGAGQPGQVSPEQAAATEDAIGHYDRGDYEAARTTAVDALKLSLEPGLRDRMLRIAVSSSCFMVEPDRARVWYEQLTPGSKRAIKKRCRRMGIEF